MTRAQLITALEAEEGPSRELDAYIWAAQDNRYVTQVGNKILGTSREPPHDRCLLGTIDPGRHSRSFDCDSIGHKPPIPHYTANIDAALSFTPEGWQWWVRHNIAGEYTENPGSWYMGQVSEYMGKWRYEGYSRATPAIALCIANLRALEAQEEA